MKAIDILEVVDCLYHLLLVDMLRKRHLYDESVDGCIAVQSADASQKLFFRHIVLIAYECRFKATLLACYNLVLDVCLRTAVVSHQHGSQMRTASAFCHDGLHLVCDFLLYCRSCSLTVNKLHIVFFILGIRWIRRFACK